MGFPHAKQSTTKYHFPGIVNFGIAGPPFAVVGCNDPRRRIPAWRNIIITPTRRAMTCGATSHQEPHITSGARDALVGCWREQFYASPNYPRLRLPPASMPSMVLSNAVLLIPCRDVVISMVTDSPAFRIQIRRWAKPSRPYTWEIHSVDETKCLARSSNDFPTRGSAKKAARKALQRILTGLSK